MRTFITTIASTTIAAATLLAGIGTAAADTDEEYVRGMRGAPCDFSDGTLALDVRAGFVIVCRDGVWIDPPEAD